MHQTVVNSHITVGAVDTVCLAFFLGATKLYDQRCMVCFEAKYGKLVCPE